MNTSECLEFKNEKILELVTNELKSKAKNYVVLKEDEKGRYIEYAFLKGAPKNNRCLSWYDKLQPNALKRNGHDPKEWKLSEVGKVYELGMFTCGNENSEDPDTRCFPGEAAKCCTEDGWRKHWTTEEPVKCGCWFLKKLPEEIQITFSVAREKFLMFMSDLNSEK